MRQAFGAFQAVNFGQTLLFGGICQFVAEDGVSGGGIDVGAAGYPDFAVGEFDVVDVRAQGANDHGLAESVREAEGRRS